jgi:hypothetical protein
MEEVIESNNFFRKFQKDSWYRNVDYNWTQALFIIVLSLWAWALCT